jgi:hypothetical protein
MWSGLYRHHVITVLAGAASEIENVSQVFQPEIPRGGKRRLLGRFLRHRKPPAANAKVV